MSGRSEDSFRTGDAIGVAEKGKPSRRFLINLETPILSKVNFQNNTYKEARLIHLFTFIFFFYKKSEHVHVYIFKLCLFTRHLFKNISRRQKVWVNYTRANQDQTT